MKSFAVELRAGSAVVIVSGVRVEVPGGGFPEAVAACRELGANGHTVAVSVFGPRREEDSGRVVEGVVNRYRVQVNRPHAAAMAARAEAMVRRRGGGSVS